MDNVTVLPPLPGSKRPTVGDPIFDRAKVDNLLHRLDGSISILRQIVSALDLNFKTATAVDDEIVSAVEEIQKLQRDYLDQLCALL